MPSLLLMLPETPDVGADYLDNMKHRDSFMSIYKSRWYQYFFSAISIYICIAPLIILESPSGNWELSQFGVVEECCLLLMIDPILVLVFIGSLISFRPKETHERIVLHS